MGREELVFNITSVAKAAVNYALPIIHSTVNVATAAHDAALRRIEQAGAKLISRVQMYYELQRDWAREATVPDFMDVFESFDGFTPEKSDQAAHALNR